MTQDFADLNAYFKTCQENIEAYLTAHLPGNNPPSDTSDEDVSPSKLFDAIRYATLEGGKRIRPILCLTVAEALGADPAKALTAGCAIELIHVYSLIHDDLPAMDDDDIRRGKPSCHKAFDEATAILAGDALQPLAFEWISTCEDYSAEQKVEMMHLLAKSSGCFGMVAGQALDLSATGLARSLQAMENMHLHKTGALIEASVLLGAISAENVDKSTYLALKAYSKAIGLAFQVQDDILDIISDTETLGKPQGTDIAHDKSTYPSLLGLEGAQSLTQTLHQQALDALDELPRKNLGISRLAKISEFIVSRKC